MASQYPAEKVTTEGSAEPIHNDPPPYNPQDYGSNAPSLPLRPTAATQQQQQQQPGGLYPPPPKRPGSFQRSNSDVDISSAIHYTRDPHRLVAYLVPFPKPNLNGIPPESIPPRFLIYTPPPPPLKAPSEGEKEGKVHKLQRKWQEEVRSAKTSDAKTASWKGLKSKATRGINIAMGYTKTSNLEFVNRLSGSGDDSAANKHANDGHHEGEETHKTVGLEEMMIIYPSGFNATPETLRQEFVDNLMRTKTKAERDAVIATGLLPVSACIDVSSPTPFPSPGPGLQ